MVDDRSLTETASARLRDPSVGWWLVGGVLLSVLVWVGFEYLGWVVFGLFTYYVARPITRRLRGRISSRSLAAGLTLTFIIVPILLFIAAFLSIALGQALQLLSSEAVTSVVERLPVPTTALPTDPIDLIVVVVQDPEFSSVLGQFGVVVGSLAATLFNVFLMLIFAFFLLVEDDRLARWFERNVLGAESLAADYLRRIDRGLTSVYFGYTLTIFVVIVLAAVIYNVFNLLAPPGIRIPAAMLLAVVTGVFTLIPLVGRSIVYAFIVVLLSIEAYGISPSLLWIPLIFFALMVVVFDNVVRTYIRPYLSGKTYHMALVMFAYLLGPVLFGWYGVFLGPLLMVVTVEFALNVLPLLAGVAPSESPPPTAPAGRDAVGGGQPSMAVGDRTDSDREETPTG